MFSTAVIDVMFGYCSTLTSIWKQGLFKD